ncbi:ankyrin, partial [Macroventuria anomochaeta]
MPRRLHHEDYTVGWVCALAIELVAAQEMLDEEHDTPSCNAHDTNIYTCGRIGEHYVVIACLPEGRMGTTSAATVANQMKMAFTSIRFGLMVGIGGGIPSEHADIRLGDVIVSKPQKVHGGVVQYDFGKATISGFERTGFLDGPPTVLLNAVTNLRAKHMRRRGKLLECLSKLDSLPEFTREAAGADVLFEAEYQHVGGATCENCSKEYVLVRETRRHEVMVHYGTIASGNEVIQDAAVRDRVSADLGGVLCFEMEAAGLMNSFPCLVIRGISDYADSHKNEQWQPYAAATAAAYAKELLSVIPVLEVNNTRTAKEATDETGDHPAGSSAPAKRRMDDSLTELEASHGNQQTVTPVAKECLRSLAFREQEQRYDNVHTAQHTCQWLLEDRQYRAWLDSPRGLFLIKGHPGTGKSVLIKFAVNALRKEKPDGLIVSFFIHGQGNDLQHTPLGIFRALLNSMLERFPEHLSQLTNIFEERNRRFGDYKEGRWGWTVGELQDTLSQVLREGTTHEPVTIFIDALDECGEEAAKGLLTYLNKQAGCETAQVKICVSSRHYPILSRDNIPGVLVEEHNAADIARFTQDRLERIQSADERRQIELKIRRKAQGGFQWVLLVTEMMIDGDLKGLKLERLRKKLDSCPGTLSELYAAILNDVAGAEERQLTKLFEWILFAERPLSAQELREALVTEPDMSCTSISELRDHDSWSDTLDAFERHVKHLSKGLVEFQTREFWELYDPEGEDWNREAQLIHQSVADFLLEKFLAPNSMGDPRIPTSLGGAGHFRISRSCLRYLTLKEVLNEAQSPRAALSSKYTLAPYAVRYAFQHIRKVEQAGIIQDDLLSAMQWASRSEITRKLAQLWRTLDPDSAHTPLGWPFEGATALHVLAACGSKTACSTVLNIGLGEVDRKDANGNTPLMLAIREKHQDIALMLVDSSVERRSLYHERGVGDVRENLNVRADGAGDLDVTNDEGDTALTIALDENAGEVILRLIEAGAELKYLGQHSALVALAISSRNMPVLDILIQNQINLDGAVYFVLDDESAQGDPSLLGLVSKLLEAKANTTKSKEGPLSGFSGRYDHHALTVASRSGTTKMVDLLLSYGASATDQNERGETPLMAAVINGHKQIVQTLLQSAPSAVEIADENGTPVLFAALQSGQPELLDVLLRQGHFSDPVRSRESLFVEISRRGLANMITFMLQRYTMDLNLQDENRCTPLLLAAENGHLEAVKLLLKENADLETPNQDGWTPLISASEKGYLEIAKSLLDKGADWSTAAKDRWTALNAASSNG